MPYKNFQIIIGGVYEEEKHSVLGNSPAGGFSGSFVNPLSDVDFKKLVDMGLRVRSAEDKGDTRPLKSTDEIDDMGNRLTEALFQGQVLDAYSESIGGLATNEGLRIRIQIDPNIKEYAKLMNLPWEFLRGVRAKEYIELKSEGTIVRDPITVAPPASLPIEPPVRILAAICQPSGYPPLQLDKEILSLVRSSKVPGIEVEFLEDATLPGLAVKMSEEEYHIFHFIGHGGVDKMRKSALIFKDGEENEEKNDFINADDLKVALRDSIRLVFLNACATANIPVDDPFTAFPTELLNHGIPAVIAMQFPISNEAATAFCAKFYTCMAKGTPVDQCMGEARKNIFLAKRKKEWGTPVLFMNSPDGTLFKIREQEAEQEQADQRGEVSN